jgi:hypothetical protein
MHEMNEQLNERIAREVMGITQRTKRLCRVIDGASFITVEWPDYSGDMSAAWQVVEELAKRLIWLGTLEEQTPIYWYAAFRYWMPEDDDYAAHWLSCGSGFCKSAPLAICMAALDICAKLAK